MVLIPLAMGSSSDWDTLQHAAALLDEFGVAYDKQVLSAHRMPDDMFAYAEAAGPRGLRAIIAGAGGAAHLPGMTASMTALPVVGVPVPLARLDGLDSLLSIVQMPSGVPVATVSIGGAVISPGDIVVGDEDGVVSFTQGAAPALLEAVKAQRTVSSAFGIEKASEIAHTIGFWWSVASLDYFMSYTDRMAQQRIASGEIFMWDDGEPVSMAGSARPTRRGICINAVYTPHPQRKRGYASACVSALSQLLLNRGYEFCMLYTDLTNPTSNAIYQAIGYEPVIDSTMYRFGTELHGRA